MLVKTPLQEKQNKQARPNRRPANTTAKKKKNNGSSVRYGTKKSGKQKTFNLPSIPAWKMIMGAIVLGTLGVFYLNHVFATQQLLTEVQQLENEYQKAKRRNADYRLNYDRMIGPKEIYEKAKNQGFINGGPTDNVIIVEEE